MSGGQRACVMLTAEEFAAVEYLLVAHGPGLITKPEVFYGAVEAFDRSREWNPWVARVKWTDVTGQPRNWKPKPARAASAPEGVAL